MFHYRHAFVKIHRRYKPIGAFTGDKKATPLSRQKMHLGWVILSKAIATHVKKEVHLITNNKPLRKESYYIKYEEPILLAKKIKVYIVKAGKKKRVHAKSNATSDGIDGFDDSGFSYMVHMLFIWTSCMVRLGFICCSFELSIWFNMITFGVDFHTTTLLRKVEMVSQQVAQYQSLPIRALARKSINS